MQIVIVTGMTGAGRTTALGQLECMGWQCIAGLPAAQLVQTAQLCRDKGVERLAVGMDARSGALFDPQGIADALDALRAEGDRAEMLLLTAADDVLAGRLRREGRAHPLAQDDGLEQGIARERALLAPFKACAGRVIDTSAKHPRDLRAEVSALYSDGIDDRMLVEVMSFGFMHGTPSGAELVLDVRFLVNPYYVPHMRERTGLDADVRAYVLDDAKTQQFLERLRGTLGFMLESYAQMGHRRKTIAIGCTGGHHRSVSVAQAVGLFVEELGYRALVTHRDVDKKDE